MAAPKKNRRVTTFSIGSKADEKLKKAVEERSQSASDIINELIIKHL